MQDMISIGGRATDVVPVLGGHAGPNGVGQNPNLTGQSGDKPPLSSPDGRAAGDRAVSLSRKDASDQTQNHGSPNLKTAGFQSVFDTLNFDATVRDVSEDDHPANTEQPAELEALDELLPDRDLGDMDVDDIALPGTVQTEETGAISEDIMEMDFAPQRLDAGMAPTAEPNSAKMPIEDTQLPRGPEAAGVIQPIPSQDRIAPTMQRSRSDAVAQDAPYRVPTQLPEGARAIPATFAPQADQGRRAMVPAIQSSQTRSQSPALAAPNGVPPAQPVIDDNAPTPGSGSAALPLSQPSHTPSQSLTSAAQSGLPAAPRVSVEHAPMPGSGPAMPPNPTIRDAATTALASAQQQDQGRRLVTTDDPDSRFITSEDARAEFPRDPLLLRTNPPAMTATQALMMQTQLDNHAALTPAGLDVQGFDAGPDAALPEGRSTTSVTMTPQGQPATMSPAQAQQVTRQIAMAIQSGGSHAVEITLNPAELGHVRISLSSAEAGMIVSIQADRPETLELMRRHADLLASDFRDIGYDSTTFSFEGRDDQGRPRAPLSAHDGNDPHQPVMITQAQNAPPPATSLRTGESAIDIRL